MQSRDLENSLSGKSIESRLYALYDVLSVQELRLADLILSSPGLLASYSATELSASAGVSKSTTTRFFHRLEYESYSEARQQARALQGMGSPLYLKHQGTETTDLGQMLRVHLNQEIDNLTKTFASLCAEDVTELVQRIAQAKTLYIIGYRHSQTIASMLQRDLIQVRNHIVLLPQGGDTLAEYMAEIDDSDLAICIGLRRRVPQLTKVVELFNKLEVPVCLISDIQAGKLASHAQWVVRCNTDGSRMFDSTASIASFCNLLSSLVASELTQSKRSHLERVERLHEALGELE
jgi:DNA-binding MurR/RpiR family transcriptional regulator